METVTTKILELSRTGRVRLYGNAWYTPTLDCSIADGCKPLKAGTRYSITIDPELRSIHAIKVLDAGTNDSRLISLLYSEIDRLNGLTSVQRAFIQAETDPVEFEVHLSEQAAKGKINLDSFDNEIARIEHNQAAGVVSDEVKPESWISYTDNPGLVTVLWNRVQSGHVDRLKSGKDIRARIADFCDGVPIGLLPDEIKDHMPVTCLEVRQS